MAANTVAERARALHHKTSHTREFSCHSSRTTRTRLSSALALPPGHFSQEEAKQSARKLRKNRKGEIDNGITLARAWCSSFSIHSLSTHSNDSWQKQCAKKQKIKEKHKKRKTKACVP
jgi:hypothetical protein